MVQFIVNPLTGEFDAVGILPGTVIGPGNGGTGVANPTAHTLPVAEGALPFNFLGPLTNGQLLIGSTGLDPVPAAITSTGGTVLVTLGAGTINLEVAGAGFTWTDVTSATQTLAVENGYVSDRGGGVTFTLPATTVPGATIIIVGKLGLWSVAQNANQQILVSSSSSTIGIAGSISSTNVGDCIEMVAITGGASTVWRVRNSMGNITVA